MIKEPHHKDTGETISEVIAMYPNELSDDAVGVWHIVPDGETGFGLSGKALAEFLKRAILALLDAGAVPVRHFPGNDYEWVRQNQYGTASSEIADAIVREWEPVPNDSKSMIESCPWFARPDSKHPYFVKMD
jgi:hypothetical protein